jgi:hypothetical protein
LAASVRYGFVCYAQRSEDAETDDRSARQVTRYVVLLGGLQVTEKAFGLPSFLRQSTASICDPAVFHTPRFFQHFLDLLRRRAR